MLWVLFAFGSAFFAGVTAILAKIGMEHVNSTLATALRTIVVLVMAWVVVFVTGKQDTVKNIPKRERGFLALSGIATGASWSPSFFPMWSFMKRSPEKPSSACSSSCAGRC